MPGLDNIPQPLFVSFFFSSKALPRHQEDEGMRLPGLSSVAHSSVNRLYITIEERVAMLATLSCPPSLLNDNILLNCHRVCREVAWKTLQDVRDREEGLLAFLMLVIKRLVSLISLVLCL